MRQCYPLNLLWLFLHCTFCHAFQQVLPLPAGRNSHWSSLLSILHAKRSASSSTYYNAADYYTYDDALYTQAVTDVDDTLKSSGGIHIGGIALGGIDVQYGRGQVYPGVAEFMLQISIGATSSAVSAKQTSKSGISSSSNAILEYDNTVTVANGTALVTPPKLAILTARAEEFKQALQLKEDSPIAVAFKKAGENNNIDNWGIGPVLYGSLFEWIWQDRKGLRKFNNLERLLQQDPTGGRIMNYVYVGDTGEYDQQAGETMLREYPNVIKAVFLHVVSNKPNQQRNLYVPPPRFINGRPMVYFRTYVGAALIAVQLGLINRNSDGLERVMEAAIEDLQGTPRDSSKWQDVERDLEAAYDFLDR